MGPSAPARIPLAALLMVVALLPLFHAAETLGRGQSSDSYVDDPTLDKSSNYSKVSCNFSQNKCGWNDLGSGEYSLLWIWSEVDSQMSLLALLPGDRKGRLASPWLQPLNNSVCKLQFRYLTRKHKNTLNCGLSLFEQKFSGDERPIWHTPKDTCRETSTFSGPISQPVNCSGERYRILFEGWHTDALIPFNENAVEIAIKAIRITVQPLDVTLTTDITREQTSTATPGSGVRNHTTNTSSIITTTDTLSTPSGAGRAASQFGLDAGPLAGIIIAVTVTVIAVLLLIFIVARRRRRRDGNDKRSTNQRSTGVAMNCIYMQDPEIITGNNRTTTRGNNPAAENDTDEDHHYDLADLPPAPTATPPPPPPPPNDNYENPNNSCSPPPPNPHHPSSPLLTTSQGNVYDHTDSERRPPPPPPLQATVGDNHSHSHHHHLYDHRVVSEDNYDRTSGAPATAATGTAAPGNTYDHVSGTRPPQQSTLGRAPAATPDDEDAYEITDSVPQATYDNCPPQLQAVATAVARNRVDDGATTCAKVGTIDYEIVEDVMKR
ncbi:uncharacterized protein LOC143301418 [Babylonia areolata]|uniref:uncharacterized protein LOC143301418 n=1 Tax=Babylonia areolata TaxID=304850 RepID=UPI003FD000BE